MGLASDDNNNNVDWVVVVEHMSWKLPQCGPVHAGRVCLFIRCTLWAGGINIYIMKGMCES